MVCNCNQAKRASRNFRGFASKTYKPGQLFVDNDDDNNTNNNNNNAIYIAHVATLQSAHGA